MQLSLSGFLFEDDYASQSMRFPDFCALAHSAGYDGVELRKTQINPDTPTAQRRQMLATIKEHGLAVTCLTARGLPEGGTERDEFLQDYLELCEALECGLLKISSDTDWMQGAAAAASKSGVVLAANNHVGGPLETIAGTRAYLGAIAHPNFGLLYDPLHLWLTGQDYAGCIREFFPATRNILVHSLRPAESDEAPDTVLGKQAWVRALPDAPGAQDWPAIFRAYNGLGYDGLVTVIESGWPVTERVKVARHCAEVIREMWR